MSRKKKNIWIHARWLQTSTNFEIAKEIDWNSNNYVHVMNSHNSDYFFHFESFVIFAKFCKKHSIKNAKNNIMIKSIIAKLIVLQIFNYTINWFVQSYTHLETYSKIWVCWIESKICCWFDYTDFFHDRSNFHDYHVVMQKIISWLNQ